MKESSDPLIVEKNSKPLAVLIPYSVFQSRFVELLADSKRKSIVELFNNSALKSDRSSIDVLRAIRYGQDN